MVEDKKINNMEKIKFLQKLNKLMKDCAQKLRKTHQVEVKVLCEAGSFPTIKISR